MIFLKLFSFMNCRVSCQIFCFMSINIFINFISGYAGFFKQRTGGKCDGCSTFFKTSVFELEDCKQVEYLHPEANLLDRDNVALLVLLRPKCSSVEQKLCIANTHLLYNPRRGDVKLAQLNVLLAEIECMAYINDGKRKTDYYPIILCGDFNLEPFCDLYRFISDGSIRYKGLHVSRMSGQTHRRTSSILGKQLLPEEVGVSEQCQYVETVAARTSTTQTETMSMNDMAPFQKPDSTSGSRVSEETYDSDSTLKESETSSVGDTSQTQTSDSDKYLSATSASNLTSSEYATAAGSLNSLSSELYFSATEGQESDGISAKSVDVNETFALDSEESGTIKETAANASSETDEKSKLETKTTPMSPTPSAEVNLMLPPKSSVQRVTYSSGYLSHPFNMLSVYKHFFRNYEPEASTSHDDKHTCVDFIFYTVASKKTFVDTFGKFRVRDVQESNLSLISRLRLMTGRELHEMGSLPNDRISSDHICVGAKFILKQQDPPRS